MKFTIAAALSLGLGACAIGADPQLESLLARFVDQQVDAGLVAPVLDPDDPLLRSRQVFIHHDINARSAADVSMRLRYLDALDPRAPIDLYISTQGGWNDNAFGIIDTMRSLDAPVNTWAIGGCYSAGALILAAGTGTRRATRNALIMVHASLSAGAGEYAYAELDRTRYERVWRDSAKLPQDWFPMTSGAEYFLDAGQALRFAIIDEIASGPGP